MSSLLKKDYKLFSKAAFAAFGVYFCMYAFRKPFTVATFDGISYFGVDYKVLLVISQVLGYFISKFIGIKVISEMKPNQRLKFLFAFILFSELSLICFAIIPQPYNIICMFFNGLPLGMIWGIVFSYIEGRKISEKLGLILCTSFIVSSGVVKSIGKWVLESLHVSEINMPFVTGALFLVPLYFFGKLLESIPPPSKEDMELKTERLPLDREGRKKIYKTFSVPLILLIIIYTSLTIVRDFRDNFAVELWNAIGFKDSTSVFTLSELPIAIIVLLTVSIVANIKDNEKAFLIYHILLFVGLFILGASTLMFLNHILSPFLWMTISGLGVYLTYIPFNGLYFDRMIATFKINGNVGFLIYLIDSFGYLGSVSILLFKNFGTKNITWLNFYCNTLNFLVIIGSICVVLTYYFFYKKAKITQTLKNYEI